MAREVLFKLRIDDSDLSKVGKFERRFKDLHRTTQESFDGASSSVSSFEKKFNEFGNSRMVQRGMRSAFQAITDGVMSSVTAFGEFEQGMREIQKIAGGSTEEIDALGEALRSAVIIELKGTTTLSQLQDIAAISSKFGVAVQDLTQFSTNVAKMSKLWDINVEKTAETTAKIIAQYRLQEEDITNIGSAVDGIADSFATSEKFLLEFAQRTSGTARTTSQSLTDILAVGAQIAVETGMRVQAASTAYTKVFQTMRLDLQGVTDQFGGSVAEWERLINEDGLGAFNKLLQSMQEIRDVEGPQALVTSLEEVFGKGTRINQLLLGMIDSYEDNAKAAEEGAKVYEENTRLLDNFGKSIESQQGQLSQLTANIKELATSFGQELQPAVEGITGFANNVLGTLVKGAQEWRGGLREHFFDAIAEDIIEVENALTGMFRRMSDLFTGQAEDVITPIQKITDWIYGVEQAEQNAEKAAENLNKKTQKEVKKTTKDVKAFATAVDGVTRSTVDLGKVAYGQSVYPNIQQEVYKATTELQIMTQSINTSSSTVQVFGNTSQQVFSTMQQTVSTTTQKVNDLTKAIKNVPALQGGGGSGGSGGRTTTSGGGGLFVGTGREWTSSMQFNGQVGTTVGGVPPWQNRLHGSGVALNSLTGFLSMHQGGLIKAHNGLRPDEIPVVMQSGEGVLSRRGMQTLERLNQGQSMGGNITINVTGKVIDKSFLRELRQELQRSQRNVIG